MLRVCVPGETATTPAATITSDVGRHGSKKVRRGAAATTTAAAMKLLMRHHALLSFQKNLARTHGEGVCSRARQKGCTRANEEAGGRFYYSRHRGDARGHRIAFLTVIK